MTSTNSNHNDPFANIEDLKMTSNFPPNHGYVGAPTASAAATTATTTTTGNSSSTMFQSCYTWLSGCMIATFTFTFLKGSLSSQNPVV